MKTRIFYIILILILIFCFLCMSLYFFKFHGNLSNNNSDWTTFGSFIGGIAAFFNLLIFILISFYIAKINVNWKEKELKFQKETVIFKKTSEIFEEITLELSKLKTILVLINDQKKVETNILSFYDKIEFFENILKIYCPSISQCIDFNPTKNAFKLYLNSLSKNKEKAIVDQNKYNLIDSIEKLIENIGNEIIDTY